MLAGACGSFSIVQNMYCMKSLYPQTVVEHPQGRISFRSIDPDPVYMRAFSSLSWHFLAVSSVYDLQPRLFSIVHDRFIILSTLLLFLIESQLMPFKLWTVASSCLMKKSRGFKKWSFQIMQYFFGPSSSLLHQLSELFRTIHHLWDKILKIKRNNIS